MTLKIYRVAPLPRPELLIVADDTDAARRIFVQTAGQKHPDQKLVIEEFTQKIRETSLANLDDALANGVRGVLRWTEPIGWFVAPPE